MPGGSSGGGQSGSSGGSGMPGGSSGGGQSGSGGAGMPGGSSGGSGMPGGGSGTADGGTPGDGSGSAGGGAELPGAGQSGGGSGSEMPGGQAGSGLPGSGSGTGSGDEPGSGGEGGWEDGLPGGSEDGWETSNQVPGTARIPPMPSERGKPPGSGDGELDGALEDFDGEILSEREVIRERSNETAGTGGGGASLPEASAGEPGGSGNADMPERGGPLGVPSNRNSPPPPSPVATAGVPDDIPDAKDDDIIARQLREAAMQETDPELKEKLWDEYRRYKGI
jgi:hypothetical protein